MSEGKGVGKAAMAFTVKDDRNVGLPSYAMGNLILPEKAIKDTERVGVCAHAFTVVKCQENALELTFGDPDQSSDDLIESESATRMLLRNGSMFHIPPGNYYRLVNHSDVMEAHLTWTIIRPHLSLESLSESEESRCGDGAADDEDDDEEEEEEKEKEGERSHGATRSGDEEAVGRKEELRRR